LLAAIAAGLASAVVVLSVVSLLSRAPAGGVGATDAAVSHPGVVVFRERFDGPDGLITNHYATWNSAPWAVRSLRWQAESGTLLRRDGVGWTGSPSDETPSSRSTNGTGSQLFRVWTVRSDFRDGRIDMRLRNEGYDDGSPAYPRKSWDGVKLWPRREPGFGSVALYTAEVNRRQGNVMIQKKCAGSDEYAILAQTADDRPARIGQWEHVGATIHTHADGSVSIGLIRDGAVVLRATDRGAGGCPPIAGPGKVGVRGDNAQFSFDDFTVTALDR
jgi:hypothetical protein